MSTNKQAQAIISDIRLKHGSSDAYAPIIRWDEFQVISNALEAAEKRIAELEAREVQLPKPELVGMGEWPMFNQVDVINALASVGISVKGE